MLLTLSFHSGAAIYKCETNGKTIFSDKKCGGSTQEITLKSSGTLHIGKDRLEEMSNTSRITRKETKIKRLEDDIKSLQKKMDIELNALRRKKLRAANNQAGATWEESISTEMQAVADKYKIKIDLKRDEIERVEDDISYMNKK